MTIKQWPPDTGTPIKDVCEFLYERIQYLEKRLLLLEPDENKLIRYPALAKAYEEYKIVERLTIGNE